MASTFYEAPLFCCYGTIRFERLGAVLALVNPDLSGVLAYNLTGGLLLGLLVALARPLPAAALALLALLTGLGHGYGNGVAMGPVADWIAAIALLVLGLNGRLAMVG